MTWLLHFIGWYLSKFPDEFDEWEQRQMEKALKKQEESNG